MPRPGPEADDDPMPMHLEVTKVAPRNSWASGFKPSNDNLLDEIAEDTTGSAGLFRRHLPRGRSNGTRSSLRQVPAPTGLLGTRRIRFEVLDRQTTYESFAVATEDSAVAGNDDDTVLTTGTSRSLGPRQLLGLERGTSVVVTPARKSRKEDTNFDTILVAAKGVAPMSRHDDDFFQERAEALRFALDEEGSQDHHQEVRGCLGWAWRLLFRFALRLSYDEANGLRTSRPFQLSLSFQTAHEALLTGLLIEALDRNENIKAAVGLALSNRNVSRLLVQVVQARYDWFYHLAFSHGQNRLLDASSQFPVLSRWTAFTATENFPSTRNHALGSIFRLLLGPGNWITRVVTRGRQGFSTDDPQVVAQNLAAESNGFETANRNQYGTHVGRLYTNEFRLHHRLPVDESLVRTFVTAPEATMLNNGIVHVLRSLAKHWANLLGQPWGNFAHQRMEQLDPFETLRFHMPTVLTVISSWRGRNTWDSKHLAPLIQELQALKPMPNADKARNLVAELRSVVWPLCGGISTLVDPLNQWLDVMDLALRQIYDEALEVLELITTVDLGIRLGYDVLSTLDWKVPSKRSLKAAIKAHILNTNMEDDRDIPRRAIAAALNLTTPRDKRSLMELLRKGFESSKPAQLLLGRVTTLLQRELRRHALHNTIRRVSVGERLEGALVRDDWYWLTLEGKPRSIYIYVGRQRNSATLHTFMHVDSGITEDITLTNILIQTYIPVAEAISRAQRVFCQFELEHGRIFSLNALMELSFLRTPMRRLVVISQMNCEALDDARLNVLKEVQRSNPALTPDALVPGRTYYEHVPETDTYTPFVHKEGSPRGLRRRHPNPVYVTPPQNLLVLGGGPSGLMTTIHCCESVLATGGQVKLYEARDAFAKGGSTFERAQIVRLDARWIAMMRYHLGTTFEDIYIPAAGETDAQLGNTLPTQGFVEITIKDLENMLHIELSRLWSKGLIAVYTDSKASYDIERNTVVKLGKNLKKGDSVLRKVDSDGIRSEQDHTWKVSDIRFTESLHREDLELGRNYGIFTRSLESIMPYRLVGINLDTETYSFRSLEDGANSFDVHASNLPTVYPEGTDRKAHSNIRGIVLESKTPGSKGSFVQDDVDIGRIADSKFTLDIGRTHVVEAIGKPYGSKVHLDITTNEPYGVCCIQGLKVSLGMHNFGEKRFGSGFLDDIRSINDQNTRIVGDFTKMVRVVPIVERMHEYISTDENWKIHFLKIVGASDFPQLAHEEHVVATIVDACKSLLEAAPHFRRKTLQTRFFETGDNYYLGMEFPREYDQWKKRLTNALVAPALRMTDSSKLKKLRGLLMHHIDRLWYDGCLETIRTGDVYNSGARRWVPRLYLIDSYIEERLGNFPVGESFRVTSRPGEKFEVVIKTSKYAVVRSVEGMISKMANSTVVRREGNLTRGPDGNAESKVALATFDVAHYVNHRTMRVLDRENGYVCAFIGDEQSTPHFMRYSGLTGACINCFSMNTFIRNASRGLPFLDRFREYSQETNWSNSEVVTRGTGGNYGEDGFLRPGVAYDKLVSYLHSKVIEYRESGQDLNADLSFDWKNKIAAAIVPRGLEMNPDFSTSLKAILGDAIFDKLVLELRADPEITTDGIEPTLRDSWKLSKKSSSSESFWSGGWGVGLDESTKKAITDPHIFIAGRLVTLVNEILDFASSAYVFNGRISSELSNQPKAVDSIIDDFAVEAQNFANSLTQSAALAAGALALRLVDESYANIASALLGAFNILVSFETMTNVSRYKVRNEEARIIFSTEKFEDTRKAVFSLLTRQGQDSTPRNLNPFVTSLENAVQRFRQDVQYYELQDPKEFNEAFEKLLRNVNDPYEVKSFQLLITSKFAVDTYHVNSYAQESLVKIYKALDEIFLLLVAARERGSADEAAALFSRLSNFGPRLDRSLQTGPVRFGFLKKRSFKHWDVVVAIKYFYSLLWCSSGRKANAWAPIQIETLGIAKQTRQLALKENNRVLRREVRDLESLFWATRESDIASLMFTTAALTFVASILWTVARIGDIDMLEDIAFWAAAPSTIGAMLGSFHLLRKLSILWNLWKTLGQKTVSLESERGSLRSVRNVTLIQMMLTIVRLLTACTAAIALPWSIAEQSFGDEIKLSSDLPFIIAFVSIWAAVTSTVFFFVVEYLIRYNLPVDLGPFVCGLFREEIESTRRSLVVPTNDTETPGVQEKRTWEFVARDFLHTYRFDTVFAADRFGSILQYLQSGADSGKLKNDMTSTAADASYSSAVV